MRALRKARGSQLLASASRLRSTAPPSRKAGHVGSLSGLKRYPEPMAPGPEASEPSHLLTPAVSGISLFSNLRDLEYDF